MSNKFSDYTVKNPYELKKEGSDDLGCILQFSKCDSKKPLWELNKKELKAFIKFAKKVELMKWKDIKQDPGVRFEVLKNYKISADVPNDALITSMRLSNKSRIVGYKEQQFYYIVWFLNDHGY